MNKKVVKITFILLLFLALTGCESKVGKGFFPVVENLICSASMWVNNIIGGINGWIAGIILGLFNFTPSAKDFIDLVFSYYSSSLGKIILVVQILAIVAIIVQFAKSVVKSNIVGEGLGQSPIQHLKKVVTAVIVTFLIPYICISAFMLSTYAAVATTNLIGDISDSQEVAWKIYDEMYEDHVGFGTLCGKGQSEAYGISNFSYFTTTDNPEKIKHANDKYDVILEEGSPKSVTGESLHEKYCSTGETTVYNSIKYSPKYSSVVVIGSALTAFTGSTPSSANKFLELLQGLSMGASGTVLMGIISLLFTLGVILTFFFIILATLKRIIDLIVLIAMSWWYIGASVADAPQQNSIGELAKKLLSLCITNFLMLFEFFLCVYTVLGHGFSLVGALMCIVWIKVLTATPTVVEEMVQNTGTAEEAAGLGRLASTFIAKMMK